jgi:hypothetical protein
VKLAPPKKGVASEGARKKAEHDLRESSFKAIAEALRCGDWRPSTRRRSSASSAALSKQAQQAARSHRRRASTSRAS